MQPIQLKRRSNRGPNALFMVIPLWDRMARGNNSINVLECNVDLNCITMSNSPLCTSITFIMLDTDQVRTRIYHYSFYHFFIVYNSLYIQYIPLL